MFTHDCTACGRHELIFPDQITGLDTRDDSFLVHFTCWCDAPQTHVEQRLVSAA